MNNTHYSNNSELSIFRTEQDELVRGQEQSLVNWLMPAVERQSIALDLSAVERIDAAGIAALISLYARARESGHEFGILHPRPHVAELLSLVGLKPVLMENYVAPIPACEQCTAA
jgi:anti-anti-sigma factor